MKIKVFDDTLSLAQAAAVHAVACLRNAISRRGLARVIAATGTSQLEFLAALTSIPGMDWRVVELFHLDEYIGLPPNHSASFRKYLLDRLISKTRITRYHLLDGNGDPYQVIDEIGKELNAAPIDVAFVGIGENGHLAFNDPPADFTSESPYLIVELDEACRRQQVNEGWFSDLSAVPTRAISMSITQILKAKEIIVIAPDRRKANAVKRCLEEDVSPLAPASILQIHANTTVYLDVHSASLLADVPAVEGRKDQAG